MQTKKKAALTKIPKQIYKDLEKPNQNTHTYTHLHTHTHTHTQKRLIIFIFGVITFRLKRLHDSASEDKRMKALQQFNQGIEERQKLLESGMGSGTSSKKQSIAGNSMKTPLINDYENASNVSINMNLNNSIDPFQDKSDNISINNASNTNLNASNMSIPNPGPSSGDLELSLCLYPHFFFSFIFFIFALFF